MELPEIGHFTKDNEFNLYYSKAMPLKVLEGHLCKIVLEDYDEDEQKADFHTAIKNFLSIEQSVLKAVESHIFQYYKDCNACWDPEDDEYLVIDSPKDVWKHIQFGHQAAVIRRPYVDKGIYILLECNCDWEEEHGLQIVFKNGLKVNKIGPFDGHCTNVDAYNNKNLEDVIYK